MNSRRKFLQITSILGTTSLIAKSSFAVEKSISFFENKVLNKSLRSVQVLHTGQSGFTTIHKDKIVVHPEILTEDFVEQHQNLNFKTFQKGLIKTGIIRYNQDNLEAKDLTNSFVEQLCIAAENLRQQENCQFIIVYLNTEMPDATKLPNKDFWVAQLESIDLLFVKEAKTKSFSRICQGKNKKEIIICPLRNKTKDFGSINVQFDLESKKKNVGVL